MTASVHISVPVPIPIIGLLRMSRVSQMVLWPRVCLQGCERRGRAKAQGSRLVAQCGQALSTLSWSGGGALQPLCLQAPVSMVRGLVAP